MQACHACVEAARHLSRQDDTIPNLIVLGVPDQSGLDAAVSRLRDAGVPLCVFTEPDIGGQPTALATAPVYGRDRKLFREFRLIK